MMKIEDVEKAYQLLREVETLQCIANGMNYGSGARIEWSGESYALKGGELRNAIRELLMKKKEELERLL